LKENLSDLTPTLSLRPGEGELPPLFNERIPFYLLPFVQGED